MSHWVFLRGLVRNQIHWESFPQDFQRQIPHAKVHLIDLPGNGSLYQQRSPVTVSGMVDAARDQLNQAGIKGPVYLFAISLGGMVAIDWMARFSQQVTGAVIINTSLRGSCSLFERFKPRNYPQILYTLLLKRSHLSREQLILDISCNLCPDKKTLAKQWAQQAEQQPTSMANAIRQLLAATGYSMPNTKPHDHVLLLNSARDRIVDAQCSERIAQAWGWPLITHQKAGHDLTLDDSAWVLYQVQRWLARD